MDAHHGVAGGVEAQGGRDREAGSGCGLDRGGELLVGGDGLDPNHVRPGVGQRFALFYEHLDAALVGEGAQRFEELSCGPDAPCDRHRAVGQVCSPSRHRDTGPVQLGHTVAELVEVETEPVSSERVGEDDVGAGLDEPAMDLLHEVALLDVEQLGAASALEAKREERGPHRPVGHEILVVGEQTGERRVCVGFVGHLRLLL